MRLKYLFLLVVLGVGFQSCISRKQLTYLQENQATQDSLQVTQVYSKPYRVQTNDILTIDLKADVPELVSIFNKSADGNASLSNINEANLYFHGYIVDVHGNIRMPLLNDVNVLGYTLEEIQDKLEGLILEKYLTDKAHLFISVKLAGLNFTVTGEVSAPGRITIFRDKVNIIEALANAGDVTMVGDKKDVVIVRQYPDGKRIHHLDVTDANVMASPYFYVKPNDLIIVNPLPQKSLGTGTNGLQTFTTIFSIFSVVTSSILLIKTL